MKVKITAKQGYTDRWGNAHGLNEVVEFPAWLARKLIYHRIAVVLERPGKPKAPKK